MYNLDINFLKDRGLDEESQKGKGTLSKKPQESEQSKVPLYAGGAVLVALPLAALGLLFLANQQKAELNKEIRQLETEIAQLKAQNEEIASLEEKVKLARANRKALVSVFNQIKPVSAILQDISDQIPPGVQINSIDQAELEVKDDKSIPKVQLSIKGIARSFSEVNDLVLIMQASDFLNPRNTKILSAQKINNPNEVNFPNDQEPENIEVNLPQVIQFTITTEVNQVPASDLLPQLADKGAVGLVTRINTLKERGAIEP